MVVDEIAEKEEMIDAGDVELRTAEDDEPPTDGEVVNLGMVLGCLLEACCWARVRSLFLPAKEGTSTRSAPMR